MRAQFRAEIAVWKTRCIQYERQLRAMEGGGTATPAAIENMRGVLRNARETLQGLRNELKRI